MKLANSLLKITGSLVVAIVLAGVLAVSGAPQGAAANQLKPYCKSQDEDKKNCLEFISATITRQCTEEGILFHFAFSNPNDEDAPRSITAYYEGEEFYEDSGFVEPGDSSLIFGPLDEQWRMVVSWQNHIFADYTAECL